MIVSHVLSKARCQWIARDRWLLNFVSRSPALIPKHRHRRANTKRTRSHFRCYSHRRHGSITAMQTIFDSVQWQMPDGRRQGTVSSGTYCTMSQPCCSVNGLSRPSDLGSERRACSAITPEGTRRETRRTLMGASRVSLDSCTRAVSLSKQHGHRMRATQANFLPLQQKYTLDPPSLHQHTQTPWIADHLRRTTYPQQLLLTRISDNSTLWLSMLDPYLARALADLTAMDSRPHLRMASTRDPTLTAWVLSMGRVASVEHQALD